MRHGFKAANELTLHYVAHGNVDRPLLLFLHGFPEFWYVWRRQMLALGDAFHCVAPDLPGYNLSSKPADIARYRIGRLVDDVIAFSRWFSKGEKFSIVAHDWGGALAWALAIRRPDLLDKLIIINAVHPGAFQRELALNPRQRAASRYIDTIRDKGSEALYAANNFAVMQEIFALPSARGGLHPDDMAAYLQAWSQRGALTAMFNWYRAMRPISQTHMPTAAAGHPLDVVVPTRILWGMKDKAFLPGCIEGLDQWVADIEICRVPEGTHWIVHEKPDLVNQSIRTWMT